MILFDRFQLDNGLKVIVHQDYTTPIVAMNVLYDVGARDENPEKTGFAHLFEHLMFGGSANIPRYDEPLERVGGETTPLLQTMLPAIISPFRKPIWKLPSGWNQIVCSTWLSQKRAWKCSVTW